MGRPIFWLESSSSVETSTTIESTARVRASMVATVVA